MSPTVPVFNPWLATNMDAGEFISPERNTLVIQYSKSTSVLDLNKPRKSRCIKKE
jgi:hypothetical protein